MKEIVKKIWASIIATIDFRAVLYKSYTEAVRPELAKKVLATESKWDDIALNAVDVLVEKFIKPGEKVEAIETGPESNA